MLQIHRTVAEYYMPLMKRSGSGSKDADDKAEILTPEEQDKVIRIMREEMESQNRFIRSAFTVVFSAVSIVFVLCLAAFLHEPWTMVHQQRFEGRVSAIAMMVYYGVSAVAFAISAAICKAGSRGVPSWLLGVGLALGLGSLLFWLSVFYEAEILRSAYALYWLPLGNLGCLLVAVYMDSDMASLSGQLEGMTSFKYGPKEV